MYALLHIYYINNQLITSLFSAYGLMGYLCIKSVFYNYLDKSIFVHIYMYQKNSVL